MTYDRSKHTPDVRHDADHDVYVCDGCGFDAPTVLDVVAAHDPQPSTWCPGVIGGWCEHDRPTGHRVER